MSQVARFGEISLDFGKMELCRADQRVGLTLQEFKVLKFLISRPELVISRRKLMSAAWPKKERSSQRTVDNHIARLRQKIEKDPAHPVYLQTVHGVGYKFVPEKESKPGWVSEG
jgi:two-component system alkaline phosphatase synthesis response regulator PhoP